MITIQNDQIAVEIKETGGTLHSLRTKENGLEYLWQGDKAYWGGQAPNLFPFVGRLYEKAYTVNGKKYPMGIHGFLSHAEMVVESNDGDGCTLVLTDSEETREIYPYSFMFRMIYKLEGNTVRITFRVENNSAEPMYCGMGGHPGINVPLEPGLKFEDYTLAFPEPCEPKVVEFTPGVLCTGNRLPYELENGTTIRLKHELFCEDAVVIADAPRSVTLSAEKGTHGVTVSYPQMPYVGFWHKPNSDAPYVCIEPWSVLPGRDGIIEDLETMPDMTKIPAGETFENTWSITLW
jgi:galactose mutarotase-like enzyme